MIEYLVLSYFAMSACFFVCGLINLSNSLYTCHMSKSRDTRQFAKIQMDREKRRVLLCLVWPVDVFFVLRHMVERRHFLFPERFKKD